MAAYDENDLELLNPESDLEVLPMEAAAPAQGIAPTVENAAQLAPAANPNPPTPLSAIVHGFSSGASSRFADEAADLLGDPAARQRAEASAEAYPYIYGGAELGGGIAQGVAAGAAGLLKKLGTLGFGAVSGAPSGLCGSKKESTIEEKAVNTLEGLAGGAILTYAGGKFLNAVSKPIMSPTTVAQGKEAVQTGLSSAINMTKQLTTMAGTGAAANLVLQNPQSWDEAINDMKTGATFGVGLGLAAKGGAGLFRKTTNLVQKSLLKLREEDIKVATRTLDDQLNNVKSAETALKQTDIDGITAIQKLAQLDDTASTVQNQLNKTVAVIENEALIGSRLGSLPDDIDGILTSVTRGEGGVGPKIRSIINQTKGEIELVDDINSALDKIKNTKAYTSGTLSSKAAAENFIKTLESGSKTSNASFDPILNKISGTSTRKFTPVEAWEAKQQIQDLLYNKEFLVGAKGTGLRKALTDLERGLDAKLVKLDPSGELAEYNSFYSAARTAQDYISDNFTPAFFKQVASSPKDPSVLKKLEGFEKIFSGLDTEITNPLIKSSLKATKDSIEVISSSAIDNYSALIEARKLFNKLNPELIKTQTAKEVALERLSGLKALAKDRAYALESAKTGVMRQQNQLTKLQDPDIVLPVLGNLSKKARFASTAVEQSLQNSPLQKLRNFSAPVKGGIVSGAVSGFNSGLESLTSDREE